MLVISKITSAHHPPTPNELEGVKIISTDEAKKLMSDKDVMIFDMRKNLHYGMGHIPGSISLPYQWITKGEIPARKGKFDMLKLPSNKEAVIIFYCESAKGWESYNASKTAQKAGYKNIMWLREGYKGWIEKGYPSDH